MIYDKIVPRGNPAIMLQRIPYISLHRGTLGIPRNTYSTFLSLSNRAVPFPGYSKGIRLDFICAITRARNCAACVYINVPKKHHSSIKMTCIYIYIYSHTSGNDTKPFKIFSLESMEPTSTRVTAIHACVVTNSMTELKTQKISQEYPNILARIYEIYTREYIYNLIPIEDRCARNTFPARFRAEAAGGRSRLGISLQCNFLQNRSPRLCSVEGVGWVKGRRFPCQSHAHARSPWHSVRQRGRTSPVLRSFARSRLGV